MENFYLDPTHLQMIDYVARLEKEVAQLKDVIAKLKPVAEANEQYMRNR